MDATETVNYSQQALNDVEQTINGIDFSVFSQMFTLVVGATIGVSVGIIALKKGYRWVISFIHGLGN